MSNKNQKPFKKQNELLQDTIGFVVAELEAVKDSFQEVRDCIAHEQMQSSQIGMSSFSSWINPLQPRSVSFFSLPCGLSSGVTQIENLKIETMRFSPLQGNVWTGSDNPP